jgi:hypothetical protein
VSDEDSWEARMAARARARKAEQAKAEVAQAVVLNKQRPWLNGWPRMSDGRTVLIGAAVHCVCCGRIHGITCVAFPPDWEPPGSSPQWPFDEDDCPLCVGLDALMRRMNT